MRQIELGPLEQKEMWGSVCKLGTVGVNKKTLDHIAPQRLDMWRADSCLFSEI